MSRRVGVALGLHGEAGIGKTHAAAGLLRALPCASLSLRATTPLGVLVRALPPAPRLPAWAARPLERVQAGEELEDKTLLSALSAALSGLAPFALHLEDLHEADPPRQALVTALAGAVKRTPGVALLVTSRAPLPEPFLNHLLPPLDKTELDRVLRGELNTKLPFEGQRWIQERSGGNPLFALEFLRYLTRQGALWSDGQHWHWRAPAPDFVPVSIQALIEQGIGSFADQPQVRSVLEARAVLPAELPPEALETVWSQVAGCASADLEEATRAIRQRGLLGESGFAHPLFGEVVRAGLGDRRRTYAARALDALERDFPELAAGLLDEAAPNAGRALKVLKRACLAAQARADERQQAHWQAQAVRWQPPEVQPQAALEAARALSRLGRPEALDYAEQAATLPEGVVLCAELLAARGQIGAAEQKLRTLPEQIGAEQSWQLRLRHLRARGLMAEVVHLWQQRPEWQAQTPVTLQTAVGYALVSTGRGPQAGQLAQELLSRPELSGDETQAARNLWGQTLRAQGDKQRLREVERETIALARTFRHPGHLGRALTNHALGLSEEVPRADIRPLLAEASQIFRDVGLLPAYAVSLLRLAREHQYDGQHEQAETLMLEAQSVLERHDDLLYRLEAHLKLAHLYLHWQPPPPHALPLALRYARAALELANAVHDQGMRRTALRYAAWAEARAGQGERALKLAQEAVDLSRDTPAGRADAGFAYGLALEACGRTAEARDTLLRASASLSELNDPLIAQEYALEADRIGKDIQAARERRDWFLAAGYAGPARRAEQYFPELAAAAAPELVLPAAAVRLNVLGTVTLEREGVPLVYRARKRLELLAYLLETRLSGRPEATVLELLDACYPGEPEAQAQKTLRQQVYLIRGDLGAGSVLSTPNGYTLGDVGSDAEAFLAGGEAKCWRGPYLDGLHGGWLPTVRDALTQALRQRSEALLDHDPREAARLAGFLSRMEPYDPATLRLEMRALQACGEERAAQNIYRERRRTLQEVGEVLPEKPADFLAAALA